LITSDIGNKRAISLIYDAIIWCPVNSLLLLSICNPSLLKVYLADNLLHSSLFSKQLPHQLVFSCSPPQPYKNMPSPSSSHFDQITDTKTAQDKKNQMSDNSANFLNCFNKVNQKLIKSDKKKCFTISFNITSSIDLVNFKKLLQQKKSKQFNSHATQKIKSILLNNSARFTANHIMKFDLVFLKYYTKDDLTFTWLVDLELILLPKDANLGMTFWIDLNVSLIWSE